MAGWSESNRDRKERLKKLAMETIDLNKVTYMHLSTDPQSKTVLGPIHIYIPRILQQNRLPGSNWYNFETPRSHYYLNTQLLIRILSSCQRYVSPYIGD